MTTNLSRDARSGRFIGSVEERTRNTVGHDDLRRRFVGVPAAVAFGRYAGDPFNGDAEGSESLLLDVAVAGASYVAVGERGMLSTANRRWSHLATGAVPVSTTLTSVFFVDEQYGWAVGHGGVILSPPVMAGGNGSSSLMATAN